MNRRLAVLILAAGALTAPIGAAVAQGGSMQWGAHHTSYGPLAPGTTLAFTHGGTVTLSYQDFFLPTAGFPPSPLIGNPAYGPPGGAYAFGGNGYWYHTTGAYLNSGGGTLRFMLDGFVADQFKVFVQFSDICFENPSDCSDEDPFFGEVPRITGVRTDNTLVTYFFTEDDMVSGDDTGAWFTLNAAGGPAFKEFQARGGFIAVGELEVVPEPATVALTATGLAALLGVAWRRRRSS